MGLMTNGRTNTLNVHFRQAERRAVVNCEQIVSIMTFTNTCKSSDERNLCGIVRREKDRVKYRENLSATERFHKHFILLLFHTQIPTA